MAETPETPDFTTRLPGEILVDEIFSRLDTKSRLKAQQTCKRWATLASAVPIADRHGRLDVAQLPFRRGSDPEEVDAEQVSLALWSILPREGESLKRISFATDGNRRCRLSQAALDHIVTFCPNLVGLDLTDVRWSKNDVSRFNWPNLSQLRLLNEFQLECWGPETCAQQVKFNEDLSKLLSTWPLTQLTLKRFQLPTVSAPRLSDLSLAHMQISNGQLNEICRISPKISTLELPSLIEEADFIAAISALPNLQQLHPPGKISNDLLKLICTKCPQLTRLNVAGDHWCPADFECLKSLRNLKSLQVGDSFDDSQVNRMPDKWSLEEFRGASRKLTNSGLSALSRKCPRLKVVSLQKCDKITGASVKDLVENCPQLESVALSRLMLKSGVTGECLSLLGQCKFLRKLECLDWALDDLLQLQKSRQDNNVTRRLDLHLGVSRWAWTLSDEQVSSLQSSNIHISREKMKN